MDLNKVCYKHIKDTFWLGKFVEFELVIDKRTGYFNATKLCENGGKLFRNWIRLERSKDLIEY